MLSPSAPLPAPMASTTSGASDSVIAMGPAPFALDVFDLLAETGDARMQFLEWFADNPSNSDHRHNLADRLQVLLGWTCRRMLALFPQHGPSAHEALWVSLEQDLENKEATSMSINDSNVSDSILISQAAAQEAIAMEMHDSDVLSVPSWFLDKTVLHCH